MYANQHLGTQFIHDQTYGTGSSPVLVSPVVSRFYTMTDTWQVKDPRAKKTHISFFLQHLLPWQFQIFYPFVLLTSHSSLRCPLPFSLNH